MNYNIKVKPHHQKPWAEAQEFEINLVLNHNGKETTFTGVLK